MTILRNYYGPIMFLSITSKIMWVKWEIVKKVNNLPLGPHNYTCNRLKHNMVITIFQNRHPLH